MDWQRFLNIQSRRKFFRDVGYGVGTMALSNLMAIEGRTAEPVLADNPLAPKKPHFPAKAKNVIFIFMSGAPSQFDLYDPKPVMRRLHGQPVPESLMKDLHDVSPPAPMTCA